MTPQVLGVPIPGVLYLESKRGCFFFFFFKPILVGGMRFDGGWSGEVWGEGVLG